MSEGIEPPQDSQPAVAFDDVSSSSTFGIYFNSDMSGLAFLEQLNKGLGQQGIVADYDERRALQSQDKSFDMSKFITFQVQRGAENSASKGNLAYKVTAADLQNNLLQFKLDFQNPLLVSIGSKNDKLIATIVDGKFFASESNGLPIAPGTEIIQELPKMLPNQETIELMQTTKKSVESAANTFVIAQLVVTIILALSLKSMWNLMNVIQVLVYVRFFSGWPAFMLDIFRFLDDAITLKPVSDPIFEYGQDQFQKANQTLTDQGMKNMGVQDKQLVKSLGLFFVVLIVLLVLLAIYLGLKLTRSQNKVVEKVKEKLKKKLFYSSFLRYMLTSNLKLNFTVWAFLLSSFSFGTFSHGAQTVAFISMLVGLYLWPIWVMYFLLSNQDRTFEKSFQAKWDTLFQGIRTESKSALIYNSVFSMRRFWIVLLNIFFTPGFPLSNFEENQFLLKDLGFIFVQTLYLFFILQTKPHTRGIFNHLEIFNEGMIIIMCYIMIVYSGMCSVQSVMKLKQPIYSSITVTCLILLVNFGVMLLISVQKAKQKIKTLRASWKNNSLQLKNLSINNQQAPQLNFLSQIMEESREDDCELHSIDEDRNQKQAQDKRRKKKRRSKRQALEETQLKRPAGGFQLVTQANSNVVKVKSLFNMNNDYEPASLHSPGLGGSDEGVAKRPLMFFKAPMQ